MLERITRREFFTKAAKGGVVAASVAIGLPAGIEGSFAILGGGIQRGIKAFETRVALAEPAFPSWQPSLNAQPEAQAAMVPWTIKFDAGKTAEIIGGPLKYQDPDGKEINFLGQSDGGNRISIVIIKDGTPGIQLVAWGGGNWEGITDNPNNAPLTAHGEWTLIADAYKAITNPANGNGKNHDGKFDEVNLAVIDGPTGKIVKNGHLIVGNLDGKLYANYRYDLEIHEPIQAPNQEQQVQPAVEPTKQPVNPEDSTQPGFVSENQNDNQLGQETKEHSFDLQPGQQIRVPKGSIIRGEFMYKDANGNWAVKYDSNGQTGLVTITDEDVDIMTNYPVGVVENISGDLVARANAFAAEQVANGCENGQGCSQGVFIAHIPNGPFQRN